MSSKLFLTSFYFSTIILFLSFTNLSFGAQFFKDSFESGNLSHSENGAYWYTGTQGPPQVVSSENGVTPFDGSKMLKFIFQPTQSPSTWMEERFNLGANKTEVYIRYYVYIPTNYVHSSVSPSNNKVIRLWDEDNNYNTTQMRMGGSFVYNSGGTSSLRPESNAQYSIDHWVNSCTGLMEELQSNLIGTPRSWNMSSSSYGKWQCWEWHFRRDSGSGDGALEFWVDGVKQFGSTTLSYLGAPCSPGYFRSGYLFGATNAVFSQVTNIYVDDVIFSDTYIGTSDSPPTLTISAPTGLKISSNQTN